TSYNELDINSEKFDIKQIESLNELLDKAKIELIGSNKAKRIFEKRISGNKAKLKTYHNRIEEFKKRLQKLTPEPPAHSAQPRKLSR
ncbi:hypothetical protein N9L02_02765, partial [Gammaproteobacteria bacterium]|nr:hypothetical protein [Gammaproteobacteria bacterium]